MIEIGKYNDLQILRETSVGLYLGAEDGEDVLLPIRYCPDSYEIGNRIRVFVYPDNEGRKVATNLIPKVLVNEFAFLQVKAIESVGAFIDWGLDKDLLVPFREQRQRMEKGRWYVVYMYVDEKTGRLVGTNKIEQRLQNDYLKVKEGDEAELLIMQKTDLGYSAIINHEHKGLIYENEIFGDIHIGQRLTGYIKNIREDSKIDLSLQPPGYEKAKDLQSDLLTRKLWENNGFLPLNDKSNPELIYASLGLSKKAFKRTVGTLYKEKKIEITNDGIKLINSQNL
ncbi:MAG: S1-like domain-containing RNA-binding protein [Bacteroidales bacterium]